MKYQEFVKMHMSGKKFKNKTESANFMRMIAQEWKKEKTKRGGSFLGSVVGEVFNGASNLSRQYL
jgi:hypothetical protein